jgi:hypothetical protein
MNCRRVEKLIPLYVEGDIESHSRERIASHLEWCGRCNWLADEFRESQNWLRSTQTPELDEAFLDSFKADALKLIAETNAKPSLLASLIQQWTRRQVFALAGAMMIIVPVVVFYVYQAGTSERLQVAKTPSTAEPNGTLTPESLPAPDRTHATGLAPGAGLKEPRRSKYRAIVKARAGHPVLLPQTIESPLSTQISRSGGSGSFEPSVEPSGGSDDLPPMLRIEMQTSDPNIRIIWFAPKEVESPRTNQ